MVQRLGRCTLAFALVALAPPAHAFCRTTTCATVNRPPSCVRDLATQCWTSGAPLFWRGNCAQYSVDQRGASNLGLDYQLTADLVASAFATWPIADCQGGFPNIAVVSYGPASCGRAEFNPRGPNNNAVIFQEQEWSHEAGQLGLTTVSFNTSTGEILNADIEVNLLDFGVSYDEARYILTHEAGHFLGLDHSSDPSAVMYFQYREAEPILSPDDVAGICAAYPMSDAETAMCDPEPEHGFAADCGGDVEGSCAIELGRGTGTATAAIALVLLLLRVKRRGARRA
jgi:hypothetical protein